MRKCTDYAMGRPSTLPIRSTPMSTKAVRSTRAAAPALALTAKDSLVPWMNPECTGINRLRGRATLLPYASAKDALAGERAFVKSLDGTWKFQLVESVEAT